MANFVLSTHMTNGDVLPFLRLGSALRKRGHRATLVTHGEFASLAEKAGIEFRGIDEAEEYTNIMKDLEMWKDPELHKAYERKYYSDKKFRKEYEILSELCNREESVLICKEGDSYVAMMVSEKMNIPIVTGVLAPNYVTQFRIWKETDYASSAIKLINTFRKSIDLQPVSSWTSWMGTAKKYIGFWHEKFGSAVEDPEGALKVDTVGFPMADSAEYEPLPQDLLDFIDAGEPPLLITGGTGKLIKPQFYEASIEACKLMKRRTILVTRHEEFVHCELPDFIQWYRVLPLSAVYPLVSGVIHHGGIGTITGAMSAGTPQMVLAADADRPDNGLRIKNLGIGDYLPPVQWNKHIISDAVNGILKKTVKDRCLRLAMELNNHDTMTVACEVVERVVDKVQYAISSEEVQSASLEAERSFAARNNADGKITGSRKLTDEKRRALAELLHKRQSLPK